MGIGNDSNKKPIGDAIRECIVPALEEEGRFKRQLDILNEVFEKTATILPEILHDNLTNLFNRAARLPRDTRNLGIVELLTRTDQNGNPLYTPVIPLRIPVTTTFTEFSASDIKELPGYIKLHEIARAENVALQLIGLTSEEAKSGATPRLVVDCFKTYTQGALENSTLYPDLPPPVVPFPRHGSQDFKL